MNPSCPYCQCPERYDLEPATELHTVSSKYELDGTKPVHHRVNRQVVVMGHLPKHPIKDQPHFHVPCQITQQ